MITVEELIVQSLYYRLVVVNVKRTDDTPSSTPASTPAASPGTRARQDSSSLGPDSPIEPPDGAAPASNMGPGLGILYMGAMSHQARANLITKTVQQCLMSTPKKAAIEEGKKEEISHESLSVIQSLQANGERVKFSQEVKNVIDTGELSMMRAALITEGTQTDAGQVWNFGATAAENPDAAVSLMDSIPPMIDLRNCNQFSIVKLEDKRDPDARSLVMVQTKEMGSKRPTKLKAEEEKKRLDAGTSLPLRPSPIASPIMSNGNMSVYVKRECAGDKADVEPSHDLDSGIWDMAKGIESSKASTRESTPLVGKAHSKMQTLDAGTPALPECGIQSCVSPVHMSGTFKSFNVGDEEQRGRTPETEVQFAIHEEQHLPSRDVSTDTFNSDQYVTAPQSPEIHIFSAPTSDSAQLTAALESFPFEQAIPSSPEPDEDSVSIAESDMTIDLDDTDRRQGLNDFMVARERGVITARSHVEQRTQRSFTQRPLNEADFSGLNDIEPTRQRGVVVRRTTSPANLPARHLRAPRGHLDSGVRSISPADLPDSRGSLASVDSSFMSECTDFEESLLCDTDAIDVSNVPHFDRFPDWMAELPDNLTTVPLGSIIIPGSHIALAIDSDMRYDMDFSKCNYEMADFLRKLPKLAIFNNFRNLMKKIWRAWMPKQMLSVFHQLEAGSRYFDIRITKYRSAFYGEHGLYTRQFKKYLKEMKTFTDAHPLEIVILHFQQLQQLERTDKRRLVTVLFQIFGAKMARSSDLSTVTLEWLWQHKKQVIVFFPGEDMPIIRNHIFAGLVWSDDVVHTTLPKKQSVPDLVEFLDQHYVENVLHKRRKDSKLYVTKAVLSPDMTMVFGDFQYKSMRQLSHSETLHTLVAWLRGRSKLNVVCVDFVGGENLVESILLLNGEDAIHQSKRETIV